MADETQQITGRDRKPVFYLWVAGVDVLYGSQQPPARTYTTSAGAVAYRSHVSIVPNSGMMFQRRLDVRDHIIEAQPVTVVLACDDQHNTDDTSADPVNVYGRFGYEAAGGFIYLEHGESIRQTDAVPITVTLTTGAAPTFTVGDVVHIGREAFEISAMDAGNKTVTFNGRALLGTKAADHLSDPDTMTRPVMTARPVYFKGRRAVIHEAEQRTDGTVGDFVERWRGFVSHEPEFATDGPVHTLTLKISPLTALLDVPLGDKFAKLQMSQIYHTFGDDDDAMPGTAFVGTMVDCFHYIDKGALFNVSCDVVASHQNIHWEGSGGMPTISGSADDHEALVGPSVSPNNPRGIPVNGGHTDTPFQVVDYLRGEDVGDWNGDVLNIAGIVALDTNPNFQASIGNNHAADVDPNRPDSTRWEGGRIKNARANYWRNVCLIDRALHPQFVDDPADAVWPQTYRWPNRLVNMINSDGSDLNEPGWNVANDEPRGAWVNVRLNADNRSDPHFVLSNNMPGTVKVGLGNANTVNNDPQRNGGTPEQYRRWYGTTMNAMGNRWGNLLRIPYEVLSMGGEDGRFELVQLDSSNAGARGIMAYDTRIAREFYVAGERWINVSKFVSVPANGYVLLEARQGNELINSFRINECVTIDVDGDVVHRCRIAGNYQGGNGDDKLVTMAAYPGDDPIELTYAAAFSTENIGEIALQMLTSSGGNGVMSNVYDVLSHGGGLTDKETDHGGADIDVDSFLAIESPLQNATFKPIWRAGQSPHEVLTGIMQSSGYVIDIRTNTQGLCRLTAVPLGFPDPNTVVDVITESDIADSPHPKSPAQLEVFNAFLFKYNHDDEGEPQGEQRVRDQISIDTFGTESEISVELPGVQLAEGIGIVAQLRPLFARLRFDLSYPRRLWSLTMRAGLAVQAAVGGTYKITHGQLRPHHGRGVAGALARMRSIKHDGWRAVARAEFVYYGVTGAGWGPSLDVIAVNNATTVTVAEHNHTGLAGEIDGLPTEDLTPFNVALAYLDAGDKVLMYPAGDMDNLTALQVSSVNLAGDQITFQGAHGLPLNVAGIQAHVVPYPQAWGTPPEQHADYAYIGTVNLT